MYPTLVVHIVAGLVAIVVGYVALATAKGLRAHRLSGRVFMYSMMTMALIGAWLAVARDKSPEGNVPIGLLSTYLVVTGFTTVRPPRRGTRALDVALALLAAGVAFVLFRFGLVAAGLPGGKLHGIPTPPFFIFGSVALLASAGDLRLIRSGGVHLIRGAPRLSRHLWRMGVAHLIATFAFFPRLAKYIPKDYPRLVLVMMPALVVLGAVVYWLWRLRVKRSLRAMGVGKAATSPVAS